MGVWGESIFTDDDAQEFYELYRQLYNQGKDHAAVRRELEADCADSIADNDDGPIFWFAVARAQWEFGALDADVLERIENIEQKGLGLDRWREGRPRMLAKRQQVVRTFLQKIRQPNPKPKKRKAMKRHPPVYQPGDCLAIELSDGKYGALIVLATDDTHDTEGFDKVAFLQWHSKRVPPLKLFEERRWLGAGKKEWIRPSMMSCLARFHHRTKDRIRLVGRVSLRTDDPKCKGAGRIGGWDNAAAELQRYYGLQS